MSRHRLKLPLHLTSPGPEAVDGNPVLPEFLRHAEGTHGHAVLGHCVCHMVLEPLAVQVEGRADVEDLSVRALLQVR